MKVVIVNYGMGNIKSITSTLKYLKISDISVSSEYSELKNSDKIILPGVGSFGDAMNHIIKKKIDLYLQELVLEMKKPILGICLGMQLMGLSSTEDGLNQGLGFVNGDVTKFSDYNLKVPHTGFNQVVPNSNSKLFKGLSGNPDFYFTHSYRMITDSNIDQSVCDYGGFFVASYEIENIAGVQFHPELSQKNGLVLLKNFIEKF